MELRSDSFNDGEPIPADFAFGKVDPETHVTFAGNANPHLAWSGVPEGCRSFALICVDVDVPTVGDDVNKEGRTVSADLPRTEFFHWAMVDVPAECTEIPAGSCGSGVTPGGKTAPPGPEGSRQGLNDYCGWFAGDADMAGDYYGYDGPGPPWNDELVHRYTFQLFALDVESTPVPEAFTATDVRAAIEGHVLASASITGTYTLNPAL